MCGIFGITHHAEASNMTYLGLYALQHRGQEAAGINSTDGKNVYRHKRQKLVSEAFSESTFEQLKGNFAIGHLRYSTTGSNSKQNIQPFSVTGSFGALSVSHNGNLTNYKELKERLEKEGSIFQSTMDTEVFLHLIAKSSKDQIFDKIQDALLQVEGAYSLLFLSKDFMIAARDPYGIRPLVMGNKDKAVLFSSESCAFDLLEAQYQREVLPGEMVIVHRDGKVETRQFSAPKKKSNCVFEHIYFARPDSFVFEKSAYHVRKKLGEELAKEVSLDADLVIPVPDSGNFAALGFSQQSKIPFEMAFIRNHYIGRTFIEPKQSIRGFGVKIKLNPVKELLKGKKVIVIDDSIVRGTTSKKIIQMLRDAGVAKVSLMISSPRFISPCYYGVDTPNENELIASKMTNEEIADFVGADEVCYLSKEGMYRAMGSSNEGFCDACFTKDYPDNMLPSFRS